MRIAVVFAVTAVALWAMFLVALVLVRPQGVDLRDVRQAVPDTVRLLRSLHGDRSLPPGVRRWLRALLVYLAVPFDLVPDFIPVAGQLDDALVVALALRAVVRAGGDGLLAEHWPGPAASLDVVRRLTRGADA